MIDTILFPSSVFNTSQVDEDLKAEYDAVLSTGLFKILLFGYEEWFHNEKVVRWMDVFYKYRGELLTGGICIKEFLDFKRYGDRTNEYRVFYANHEITTVSRNSAQGNYTPDPPKELIEKYRNLESIYYTVDYAELEDGSWKVVEAGDGSVSGLSEFQDYEQYYRALYHSFN